MINKIKYAFTGPHHFGYGLMYLWFSTIIVILHLFDLAMEAGFVKMSFIFTGVYLANSAYHLFSNSD